MCTYLSAYEFQITAASLALCLGLAASTLWCKRIGTSRRLRSVVLTIAAVVLTVVFGGLLACRLIDAKMASATVGFAYAAVATAGLGAAVAAVVAILKLKRERDEAARSADARSAFLASMSHEIRTPMNAIIGMTELVLETSLEPAQREYLEIVCNSGEALLDVINDILDLSKIEAGKLELDEVAFDLPDHLGDTMKALAFRAHDKGLELAWDVAPGFPPMVYGDRARLRQIIINLIGNAIKFTHRGEVVLRVHCQSRENDTIVAQFSISDTGIGIESKNLAMIFEAFAQADKATTQRFGGTGLGLTISTRLVQLMGGKIWAESQPRVGSTFHFTVPLKVVAADGQDALSETHGSATASPILIVDDNETNRRILAGLLKQWGFPVETAGSADDGLAAMRSASQAGTPFQALLTDVNMPVKDGFALLEDVRQDSRLRKTPIIMLTSGERPLDVETMRKLDLAGYLIKPVKQRELSAAIDRALGRGRGASPEVTVEPSQPRSIQPLRILLVEDSIVNQRLALALLEKEGHRVVIASDGLQAVQQATTGDFDLVLMDVLMPEMDGLAATEAIRQWEAEHEGHLPIIAMTAHAMKGDRERCLAAGMDDYISKPIRSRELHEIIGRCVRQLADAGVSSGASCDRSEFDPALPARCINYDKVREAFAGDDELVLEIIDLTKQEMPQLLKSIREAIASEDADALRLAAHTLKGSVRHFDAPHVVAAARQLERMGVEGHLEGAAERLIALEPGVEALVEEMAGLLREKHLPTADRPPERQDDQASETTPVR